MLDNIIESFQTIIDYNISINLLLLIIMIILLIGLFIKVRMSPHEIKFFIPENSSSCVINLDDESVITVSDNFYNLIGISQNIWQTLVNKYHLNLISFKRDGYLNIFLEDKSVHLHITKKYNEIIIYCWSCKDIFDLFPMPISIDNGVDIFTNKQYDYLDEYTDIILPLPGNFIINKTQNIYKKNHIKINHNNITYLSPLMSIKEFEMLSSKYAIVDWAYMVCNRDGTILHISDTLIKMFNLNRSIQRIHDFYNALRGTFIPDNTAFHSIKTQALNFIRTLGDTRQETLVTMQNNFISITYTPNEDQVWIMFQDITNIMDSINNINDLQVLLQYCSDIIVIFNDNNECIWSNSTLLESKDYINIKLTMQNLGDVKEFSLWNHNIMIMNYNISHRLDLLSAHLQKNTGIIERIFEHLSNKYNDKSIMEYGKYSKFLLSTINNKLNSIISIHDSQLNISPISMRELFDEVKSHINEVFVIKDKNITYVIDDIIVNSNIKYVKNILEFMLKLAFDYQFDSKIFRIQQQNSDYVAITLEQIPNHKTAELIKELSIYNGYYGECIMDIQFEKLTLGFKLRDYYNSLVEPSITLDS